MNTRRRSAWYVVDPYRMTGAAVARYRFQFLAFLHVRLVRRRLLDYGQASTFCKGRP